MQRPFGDTDLMAYSAEHVAYEVRMFFQIVEIMSKEERAAMTSTTVPTPIGSSWERESVVIDNACIESFMTHLRNRSTFSSP